MSSPYEHDPLYRLRHALLGLLLALLLSVPAAALAGRWIGDAIGDAIGDDYAWRAGVYAGLLAYVVAGAVVLFLKVARHETRPVSAARVALWFASLWLWPVLLVLRRRGGRDLSGTA
ncbi:MAG: hypothetical protein QM702_07985 [Rubrivivax sp.]